MERESGYYWVLFEGEWEIAKWISEIHTWKYIGTGFNDDEFDDIDPERIERKNN